MFRASILIPLAQCSAAMRPSDDEQVRKKAVSNLNLQVPQDEFIRRDVINRLVDEQKRKQQQEREKKITEEMNRLKYGSWSGIVKNTGFYLNMATFGLVSAMTIAPMCPPAFLFLGAVYAPGIIMSEHSDMGWNVASCFYPFAATAVLLGIPYLLSK